MKQNVNNTIVIGIITALINFCTGCTRHVAKEPSAIVQQKDVPAKEEAAGYVNTSTQKETGFDDGTISPFTVCTTQNPNYGIPYTLNGENCMKFYWTQVGYDGTRMDRGAEACSSLNFYKDGWYGFQFYLPSPGFPTNKWQSIAQIFANGGCASWAAMLLVANNQLILRYRGNCSATGYTDAVIAGDIQRNAWKDIIIHFRASVANAGLLEVWYAGAGKSSPTYRATNINFAFGNWTSDVLNSDSPIGLKFGMYNFDDGNYTTGESRTMYFDNVSQLVGNPSNAWETVNP